MADDLLTFAFAFSAVWIALGAYLVRLHRLSERLAREIAHLEDAARTSGESPSTRKE
ncbi:MAG TPA: CcmD family protein [Candidatus Thermoplasmatota archaeon]|nr:CcmD family protein [Candidatus Thermoplasmatota archaeon]